MDKSAKLIATFTMASLIKKTLAYGLGLTLGLMAAPALAETTGGFDDLSGDADSNEVFSGSGVSLTDIMGNLRRADGLSSGDFSEKTDRDIDEAAADFRQRQQDAIDAQQGAAVETPEFGDQL